MSTTPDYGYNYVFELASKLTPEEKAKLAEQLCKFGPVVNLGNGLKMETITTGDPVFSSDELAEFERRGKDFLSRLETEEIKADQKTLHRLMMEFPVVGEEEIQAMEQARKEVNECRAASS